MNRRDAISRVGLLLGGTVVGAEFFLNGCSSPAESAIASLDFSTDVVVLLDEVGETILPTTPSSPGAKAANIGEFMKVIVTDCYKTQEQEIFMQGVSELMETGFASLSDNAKHDLLLKLDKAAKTYDQGGEGQVHYFSLMKQLTLWGYFTSEVGSKNALRYTPVPGRYEGCIPYQAGDKAWAAI